MSQAARETVNPHHLEQGAERFVRLCHQTLAQFHCVQTNTLDEPFHSEAHPGWTLLVTGTYPADRLHSMERYANLATEAGEAANAQVLRVGCPFLLGRAFNSLGFVRKWAGHVDKYLLFPLKLRWMASRQRTPTLVHITDQGLAPLAAWVRDFPTLITCHDLIAISNSLTPALPHPRNLPNWIFQHWNLSQLKKSTVVVCVSEKTARDCQRLLGSSIHYGVVMNPIDPSFLTPVDVNALPLSPQILPDRFFLHVGNNLWYKNRPGVLKIFSLLHQQRPEKLVLIGSAPTPTERALATTLGVEDSLIWIPHAPTDLLKRAYDKAVALIFPSLEEGFGWPIVEAMSRGCPVFASNRSPLTEIGGEAVVYIDPESPEKAARQILDSFNSNPHWREEQGRKGLARAAGFSIARFNTEMQAIFEKALSLPAAKT